MNSTEDFERRLRAVLAAKTGRDISDDTPVRVEAQSYGSDDDTRGIDRALRIEAQSSSGGYDGYDYDEPGAWLRLLADMEAVPDA